MGVMGTFCQICGMPVQHNCYVPHEGRYFIFRGKHNHYYSPNNPVPAFPFGPEHDWLLEAIGLALEPDQQPQIIKGDVQDGSFERDDPDHFVADGVEDRAALHEVCWELSGKKDWEALEGIYQLPAWQETLIYHEQLFDFDRIVEDQKEWMLVDPRLKTAEGQRNYQRIMAILEANRKTFLQD